MDDLQLQIRANKIFQVIKDFEHLFPDEFKVCGIYRCGHCDGTGLGNKHDMTNQCSNCGGMGYVGFERIRGEFICRACNGYGCAVCHKAGTIDWISHARGNDLNTHKKPHDYRPPESV